MKKLLITCLLSTAFGFAQDKEPETKPENPMLAKKNEVRVDLLSPFAFGKGVVSYERFLGEDWSVGLSGSFAFGKKLEEDFDEGYSSTLSDVEIIPYVRYRLSKSPANFYFIEAFASANSGKFREILREDNGTSGYYSIAEDDYFDVALGGSVGYKMYFKERVALEFLVGAGYNLFNTDKSPDVITRVGINLGYRF
ncbi:MAG: DUF3575 domain-containing protein [Flavobacterium sp.]|uniref:DUF3575 domain-containing protein n=1 Tax=Flavobacterium sp. TaxID=239 RepID=UPI0011FE339C|nr:DUF3575 domain-containing protein [Flavobacterium sp.]RZJ67307.1 MAG: DUF3575 domain-containing protein [Flavobacterium sp.]